MASLIADAAREQMIRRIRLEMAKQGLTRELLAERAGVKERTLGNLLAGHAVRDATVAKIARVLAIGLDEILSPGNHPAAPSATPLAEARADESYGGYMLSTWEHYIGTYVAYRRAFARKPAFYRSVYEIDWDEEQRRLRFFELQRFRGRDNREVSTSHAGGVYISPRTGLVHLLTTFQGALRLVTLTRFRLGESTLDGLILTQSDRDLYYQPAASAIFLEKLDGRRTSADLERLIGQVGPTDSAYARAEAEIRRIEETSVFMAGPR